MRAYTSLPCSPTGPPASWAGPPSTRWARNRPRPVCGTSRARSRTPDSASSPTWWSWPRPPLTCSPAMPAGWPTTSSPPPCWPPGPRWSCARPCTPRCGSTPPSGTTSASSRRGASAWCPRLRAGWPEETKARAGWPSRPPSSPQCSNSSGASDQVGRAARRDLVGVRVVVSAGGTREPIDPVRFISNRSSGKQGHALAEAAHRRGADVVLVTTAGRPVGPGLTVDRVETAADMEAAMLARAEDADVVVMAAAVADFRPKRAGGVEVGQGRRRTGPGPRADPRHPRASWAGDGSTARSWWGSPPRPSRSATARWPS